ncbi:hypothetical protein VFPPC_17705 [Pochonia chlamydosporia 170]|uniref:Uncharacterized protein n=1 Tax=Pochonia chlamydosporia 170 TaxID=1380566 RepID=A0A219AR89_METCM|nr:hypothetical protein VFPPC_17705 [Pochonia chlamydosporia 170]OWT43119.1 hypothetical protein VFPPC_17705 [Pochonia chlamydosporia 170]
MSILSTRTRTKGGPARTRRFQQTGCNGQNERRREGGHFAPKPIALQRNVRHCPARQSAEQDIQNIWSSKPDQGWLATVALRCQAKSSSQRQKAHAIDKHQSARDAAFRHGQTVELARRNVRMYRVLHTDGPKRCASSARLGASLRCSLGAWCAAASWLAKTMIQKGDDGPLGAPHPFRQPPPLSRDPLGLNIDVRLAINENIRRWADDLAISTN